MEKSHSNRTDLNPVQTACDTIRLLNEQGKHAEAESVFNRTLLQVHGDLACWNLVDYEKGIDDPAKKRDFIVKKISLSLMAVIFRGKKYKKDDENVIQDDHKIVTHLNATNKLPEPYWLTNYYVDQIQVKRSYNHGLGMFHHPDEWPRLRQEAYDTFLKSKLEKK